MIKKISIFTSLAIVLLLISSETASTLKPRFVNAESTTWHVPIDFPTIQDAINAADPYDTIRVSAGTYYEHLSITTHNLTIIGENSSNTIIDGNETGSVIFISARNVTITGFTVQNGIYGINMNRASNSTIRDNKITSNEQDGLFVWWESHNNTIGDNVIDLNGGHAIRLDQTCSRCTIAGNSLAQNGKGMLLSSCRYFILRNNNMTNNTYNFGVFGSSPVDFAHDIDVSNLVNGKPIYYLVNQNNLMIDPSTFPNVGYLALVNSENITVSNLIPTNNYQGVLLANTTHSSIRSVNASRNLYGIHLVFSNHNNVSNNLVRPNTEGVIGVHLANSKSNTLAQNELESCQAGVYLVNYASDNTIIANRVEENQYGISMQAFSSNNLVCHNNFISNLQQAATGSYSYNVWDDGYPSGGNYWSDYIGEDLYSGPNQSEPGSDGIGDMPYAINSDNQDNYPFTDPIGETVTNIAITNVTANPTEAYKGETINISVTIVNESPSPQTFNVTAYYDSTPVGTQTIINLAPGNETTIIFQWNTTATTPGNYAIKAQATQVPDESDLNDNTFFDGTVNIKMEGDINGDGAVDVFDLSIVAAAYGNRIGQPNYNPDADLNEDGIVDLRDLAVVCANYGDTY